jgi:hypothetical protein
VDEHTDSRGMVLLTAQCGDISWGLWANLTRNPRTRSLSFAAIGITVEVPRVLALASVALRVQVSHSSCRNGGGGNHRQVSWPGGSGRGHVLDAKPAVFSAAHSPQGVHTHGNSINTTTRCLSHASMNAASSEQSKAPILT